MNRSTAQQRYNNSLTACFGAVLLAFILWFPANCGAIRLKDIASVQGVRDNQLIGYGLVVGLDGTGDGKNASFTTEGLTHMMENMGMHISTENIKVKNIASVMVTADMPAFVKSGQTIDVTISSLGDASSLQGGTLLVTPLKGMNKQVYAIAQGPVSIGGFEVAGTRRRTQKNHLTVARIPNGATVEREVPVTFDSKKDITINLNSPDFTTVARMVKKINFFLEGRYAKALDGATVSITLPEKYQQKEVAFLADIENLDVIPDTQAKVILDERTGTVVMGENVRISELALSHGSLSLQIKAAIDRSPTTQELLQSPASEKILLANKNITTGDTGQRLVTLPSGVTLGEVVRALNSVGVAPRDLIAIFQSIKASGSLQAELKII